ncbi:ABC transporter substrate-binding protein [Paenibacillus elgii]|uniref:ABC transporter substrate-binding protein n=1 Tax=Paenibacillus elgii TaxID=189691 RepID=A0A165RQB1_9BACL|nr:ABC transporter substrate-binding protein [Paenibacillus elgii]KZE84431.1 ABC transporter substrate-binding protein [Paenibacillus elgii]MCM3267627.1 ABC transporter substrate-binding protein [Paenibacillus elgii]NEN81977.1 ABC transporter substrate-binding protein [Paenibacillus elgii]
MKRFSMFAASVMMTTFLLSGCASGGGATSSSANGGASKEGSGDAIKIGWFGPLTGPTATDGTHSRDAAMLAVEQYNASGGINGKKVELVAEDDQGKPEEAIKAVQKLVNNDKVTALVGGAYSGPTKTAAAKVQELKVPMVVAYAVHPDATKGGDYVNRVIYTGPVQGRAMAEYAVNDLKKKNIAVLYVDNDYGKSIYTSFKENVEKLGAKIAIDRPHKMGDKDFSSVLTAVKATNPDALYVVAYYNEAAAIVKQAKESGINAQLLGVDGFDSPKYLELGKSNTEGSTFTTSFYTTDNRPVVQKFVKAWHDKYKGEPDMLSSQSYDAAMVILEAMKKAGTDKEKLKQAINETSELEGTSGQIRFRTDHEVMKPVIFMTVKDGKFQFVKSQMYN